MTISPDDNELFRMVLAAEDEADAQGMDPKQRSFWVPQRVMRALGYESFVMAGIGKPEALNRIERLHERLYREKDVGVGGLHGGAFMFRGIATWIYIPIIYGQVNIDAFEFCDLNDMQKRWLASREESLNAYIETFSDLFDFAGGIGNLADYQHPPEAAMPLLGLSAFHLQSSAATLCSAFDPRGCVQSAILASELVLKAAAAGAGATEKDLKGLGHKMSAIADAAKEGWPGFEADRVGQLIAALPPYVENRYSGSQPTRREAGAIVMAAQGIAGSTMRAITGGDFKSRAVLRSGAGDGGKPDNTPGS